MSDSHRDVAGTSERDFEPPSKPHSVNDSANDEDGQEEEDIHEDGEVEYRHPGEFVYEGLTMYGTLAISPLKKLHHGNYTMDPSDIMVAAYHKCGERD